MEVVIRGKSENLPKGRAIWIVTIPEGVDRFFPQNGPVSLQSGGDWKSPPIFIGIETDTGKNFDVLAVVTTAASGKVFANYLKRGQTTGSFPGLKELPKGAVEYDHVTVIRK